MAFQFQQKDVETLAALAHFRLATADQMAYVRGAATRQTMRRSLKRLEDRHLIGSKTRNVGRGRGRPEKLFFLEDIGLGVLKSRGVVPSKAELSQVSGERIHCQDHQLLINWLEIHLHNLSVSLSRLQVDTMSAGLPHSFRPSQTDGATKPSVRASFAGLRKAHTVPDLVCRIGDSEQAKDLLFFIEVDMGSEPAASPKRAPNDFRQKIECYREYFRSGAYKQFGSVWDCEFHGFRLLVLSNTHSGASRLGRLIQEMRPSEFVWLTHETLLTDDGAGADIWSRGGRTDRPAESILGPMLSHASPLPPLKP